MTVGCKALESMVYQNAVISDDFKALLGWGMLKISENTVANDYAGVADTAELVTRDRLGQLGGLSSQLKFGHPCATITKKVTIWRVFKR